MHARDRFLPEWFNRIKSRQLTLPRFQRFIAWGHGEVSGLLTTVMRGLPSGAALILEVGDAEKFKSRTMADAPESGERTTEQLLDGQQRLTALWRSLNDKYPDRTYLVWFEEDETDPAKTLPAVFGQARYMRDGSRYPLWVDDSRECWGRGYLPLRLLRPDTIDSEIDAWIDRAIASDAQDKLAEDRKIRATITGLRTKVREFNLPYLALPTTTRKDVALDVFVKMNTSSVKLSTYDIVVALVEEETGKSLHEHVNELNAQCPRAAQYVDVPGLVLDVTALRQNRVPSQAGYRGLNYGAMVSEWAQLISSVKGLVEFLEEESVFDGERLPSYTPLPVVAALWEDLPTKPDALGNARALLKKYLWRAFLTNRYEMASATAALQDFRALKEVLPGRAAEKTVPILNADSYPLPTVDLLVQAGWPKARTILGRGMLSLSLKCGAIDFADAKPASVATITSKDHPREYHHLFPDALLSRNGIPDEQIYRAINCALITWKTNRTISDKDPLKYLQERAENSRLGKEELIARLRTHLIPYAELNVGYEGLTDDQTKSRVTKDYEKFCRARATIIAFVAGQVCTGASLNVQQAFAKAAEAP